MHEDDSLYFALRYTYREFQTHSPNSSTEERIRNFPVVSKFVDVPFHLFFFIIYSRNLYQLAWIISDVKE